MNKYFISTKSTLVLTFRNISRTPWDGLTHPLGVHAPQLGNPCDLDQLKSSINPEDFLADCVEDEFLPKRKFQGLPILSDTHWLTRVDSIYCLLQNYRAVCEAVVTIRDSSTGKSASDADSYLKRLLSFEFLVSAIICQHVLAFTRPITIALQAKECDLYKAYKMAQRLVTSIESERTSDRFQALWKVIMKVSTDLFIEPSRKRSVWRQQNRSSPPVVDKESYYRVAYYFAFVDHTLSHLKTRFPPELATFLLPGNTSNLSNETIANIEREFADHLPYPSSFEAEVATWKVHVVKTNDKLKGTDLLSTCNFADENGILPKHTRNSFTLTVSSCRFLLVRTILQCAKASQDVVSEFVD